MNQAEFTADLNVNPALVGAGGLMMPMLPNISAQRGTMVSGHLVQAMVIDNNEMARIQTGYENKYGKYYLTREDREEECEILAVIPKFAGLTGWYAVSGNHETTVIYRGTKTNTIGVFYIDDYQYLHEGFGYANEAINPLPKVGEYVQPETRYRRPPNHRRGQYCLGLNAKVCYVSHWGVAEDAFIISEDFRKKLDHLVIGTVQVSIRPDQVPLNLYGDQLTYKIFPDIDHPVRDDGIVMGLRSLELENISLSDVTDRSLRQPQMHDELIQIHPGATIIDLSVFTNTQCHNPNWDPHDPAPMYRQLDAYQSQLYAYYRAVLAVYDRLRVKYRNLQLTPELNTLITNCQGYLPAPRRGERLQLLQGKNPVEFITLKLTYAYKRQVTVGFKLTGRDGSKGVVGEVMPTEDMPMTPSGGRADIIISGESPFNRLNEGQWKIQFLNFASEQVTKQIRLLMEQQQPSQAWELLYGYLYDVRPVFAQLVAEKHPTPEKQLELLQDVCKRGIFLVIPPFTKSINPDTILHIAEKYQLDREPLQFGCTDEQGNRETFITKGKGLVGEKYILLLGKIPDDQLSATSFGVVSQFSLPMKDNKSSNTKYTSVIRHTPIRYGEAETAHLSTLLGPELVVRLLGLYSNSRTAIEKLEQELLTNPQPSCLPNIGMSTQEIIDSAVNVNMLRHLMEVCGYELVTQPNQEMSHE